MQWTVLASIFVGCGGGGKTSDTAGESTSSPQTTTDANTGPGSTTTVTSSGTTAGSVGDSESNTGPGTTDPTTGTPDTSTSTSTTTTTGPGSTSTGPDMGTTTSGTTDGTTTKGEETKGESTGDSTTDAMCAGQGDSCAKGEMCCDGFSCCSGVPIRPGKEYCSSDDIGCPISDRNAKTEFQPIDAAEVLRRVVALEITTWQYRKDAPWVRHLGPMAQDFKAAFGLGDTDKMIFPLDATGVSMAAIQALQAENEALRDRLEQVERRLAAMER